MTINNNKIGLFQIIYSNYSTSDGKIKTKKQFIFLDSYYYNNSIECIELYRTLYTRYKAYNNVITLEYDNKYKGFIFNKTRYTTLLLKEIKNEVQDGERIKLELI